MRKVKLYSVSKLTLAEVLEAHRIVSKMMHYYEQKKLYCFSLLISSAVDESNISENSKSKLYVFFSTRLANALYSPAFGYWSSFENKAASVKAVQNNTSLFVEALTYAFFFSLQETLIVAENNHRNKLRIRRM